MSRWISTFLKKYKLKKGNHMKKIIVTLLLLGQVSLSYAVGMLTNNGSVPVNVIMYNSSYKPAQKIAGQVGKSAQGRINSPGTIIPAGNNVNFLPNTTSVDVFYSDIQAGIHVDVNLNSSYTINPDAPVWTISLD
jgi:hypothetical protein